MRTAFLLPFNMFTPTFIHPSMVFRKNQNFLNDPDGYLADLIHWKFIID